MTREHAKKLLPVIEAYAAGKAIEYKDEQGVWKNGEWLEFWKHPDCYRIKPEPKLRPWAAEEVPVGAVVRQKANQSNRVLITAVCDGRVFAGRFSTDMDEGEWSLFSKCEHSTDGGKTWAPCGVEESQ